MSVFQFAIGSIVDANTGNGLVHANTSSDYASAEQFGRKIRSKSIADLLSAIASSLMASLASYRLAIKQRRDLRRLMSLNDHLLEDIGIHRGDLHAVELGISSLDELASNKLSRDGTAATRLRNVNDSKAASQQLNAVNEHFFEQRKCA